MSETGPVPASGAGPSFFRRRSVRVALGLGVLLAAGAIWAITALQKFITFPGAHPSVQQLSALGVARGEAHWFDIDGARVEAWFLPAHATGRVPLLIHGHGNGELIDVHVVPLPRRITLPAPTANTSPGPLPHTARRFAVVPEVIDVHAAPLCLTMAPPAPTA